ncbi:Oxygen-independent coproporphyrinogen-III oxidase [compost metagenome]
MVATGEYQRMAGEGGLAVVKGIELSEEDHLRSHVIERLMCDFSIDLSELQHRFGKVSHSVRDQAQLFAAGDRDGVVRLHADIFAVTEAGKPFVRNIAAIFDTYLGNGRGRHSVAV